MAFMTNSHSHSPIARPISACLLLESAMHGGGSRRSYKISTCFDALVHCSECQASRPMAIKTIKPGRRGGGDEIIYQCTRSRSVEVCGVRHTESRNYILLGASRGAPYRL